MKAPKKANTKPRLKPKVTEEEKREQTAARQRRFRERQNEKIRLLEESVENPLEISLESRVLILERRLAALERFVKKPS